jgi:hypothetical protein
MHKNAHYMNNWSEKSKAQCLNNTFAFTASITAAQAVKHGILQTVDLHFHLCSNHQ